MSEHVWQRVSKKHPCPICSRTDWCGFTAGAVCCMRAESSRTLKNGGWLHVLDATAACRRPTLARAASTRPKPTLDATSLHRTLLAATSAVQIAEMAAGLGVSPDSLRRSGWAWYPEKDAWAIPMFSDDAIVGLRLRAVTGEKWAVTGSRQGLFVPDGQMPDLQTCLTLVEGPTDVAAMLTIGLHAVGRPSCAGGHDLVKPLAAGRDVVIIADRDEPKIRPDGSIWYPGAEGAERLAAAIAGVCRSLKVIGPVLGAKDARAALKAGATARLWQAAMQNARPWTPAPKPKKVIERF